MTIWVEDKKGVVQELPDDAPARYKQGKGCNMTFLENVPIMGDVEVYNGCSWIPVMRLDPPKEMIFEVRALVHQSRTSDDVSKTIQDALRLHDGGHLLQHKVRYIGQPPVGEMKKPVQKK